VPKQVAAPIEFRLLGPIDAERDGTSLPLGGPRQRALLALLLLEPGRPVEVDRLVDELWHGEPPAGAATTLRSYVSRLRKVLGEGASLTSGAGR
jgi:DNA-binding SARP family transcriptional activator